MKCKTCGTDHRGVAKHGGYCLDHQEQRAEAAEARAAQLEAERDAFAAENDAIHRAVNEMCGTDTSTIEAVQHVITERDEARRKLEQAIVAERVRCIETALDCFFDLTGTSTMSAPEVIKRTRHGIADAIRARSNDPH